ncbi:D-alanyl-D-alanine carboxypeptidase [Pseudoglutamicibacter albus]|uniref:D-alanyl-D-alanine carboxypeptidase n=1 Tax=Pseudoglutamicibacter albus TaxID=98671 RepID=UPI0036114DD4
MIPASSLKVLTGTAVVSTLGLEDQWVTRTVLDKRGSGAPVVWLVAGGDVMLNPGASDAKAVNGRAGLKTLAEQTAKELKASGALDEADGSLKVGVDTRMFTGPALNPDWADDLVSTNNVTEIAPIALYAGRSEASHTSPVVRNPDEHALEVFTGHLQSAVKSGKKSVEVKQASGKTKPGFDAVDPFEPGSVEGQLAAVHSATVREQLAYGEAHSDNVILETYGRLVGIKRGHEGSTQGAIEGVKQALEELGVETNELVMRDTSGLSDKNRVQAGTLADVMALTLNDGSASQPARRDLAFVPSLLPRAGVNGTMETRLDGKKTKALVLAKTGTLADVISLTGVVTTKEGRPLGFSIIFNDVEGNLDAARASADAVATALADCGCQ